MIVKLIPENDIEKSRMRTVEHKGVKNLFMFGVKKEQDEELRDFHDWNGDFKFLLGNLHYFTAVITEEQNYKLSKEREAKNNEITLDPQLALGKSPAMIKRGGQTDSKIVEILNPDTLEQIKQENQDNAKVFQFLKPETPPSNVPVNPAVNTSVINDGFDPTPPETEDREDEAEE